MSIENTKLVHTSFTESVNIFFMEGNSQIAQLIQAEMDARNLGVRRAAAVIGISHPTLIKALEDGKISFETAVLLSKFLRRSPEAIMRIAGLLPHVSAKTENHEKFLYLLNQLNEIDQETVMNLMQVLLSKK